MAPDVLNNLDDHIRQARHAVEFLTPDFGPPVIDSIEFLNSPLAAQMVARDPYWPKWNSPWWHALLLGELQLAALIPSRFWTQYKAVFEQHYLPFFPFREEEVPVGRDPLSSVACHCYLGSVMRLAREISPGAQISSSVHINSSAQISPGAQINFSAQTGQVSFDLPQWTRDWWPRYQNADGGLNCDEGKYLKDNPTSSLVSTAPAVEALLAFKAEDLSGPELEFLDKAALYFVERKLMRGKRSGEIIDESWLEPAFPRFYHYDILRGLSLVTRWSLKRSRKLSKQVISEALGVVAQQVDDNGLAPRRSHTAGLKSLLPKVEGGFELEPGENGGYQRGEASRFALLDYVDRPGLPSLPLTQEWLGLLLRLKYMSDSRLLAR